jgi:1-acyl-sn-glycerol-3-phosphate acyltransferase
MAEQSEFSTGWRLVTGIAAPIMTGWARMRVRGLEHVPVTGPTLLVANHDSYWDPIAIAVALRRRRQVRALAKSSIWKNPVLARLMTDMGHIPVDRGAGDGGAIAAAVAALAEGGCVGVFPEGTRSLGRDLRARSGGGRLLLAVPRARLVCARVTGTTDVVRVPTRPRITVEFFVPAAGPRDGDESAAEVMRRVLAEIRHGAPRSVPGRKKTAAKYRARQAVDG